MQVANKELYRKRLRAERRFVRYGQAALVTALLMLVILLGTIFWRGAYAFVQADVLLPVTFDAKTLEISEDGNADTPSLSLYQQLAQEALRQQFPEVTAPGEKRLLSALLSSAASEQLRDMLRAS